MILTYIRLKSPSLCQRMLAWLVFIGVFNDGFALRLVPPACVRSPVSLYHSDFPSGPADLVISGFNMFSAVASVRKIGSTFLHIHPLGTRTMRRPQWDSWSCTYYGGHCPLHVIIRSHLQDRLLRDFSFVLRRAQNPHLPESFLDDGGVLCGLLTLFLPDQSRILNPSSLVVR